MFCNIVKKITNYNYTCSYVFFSYICIEETNKIIINKQKQNKMTNLTITVSGHKAEEQPMRYDPVLADAIINNNYALQSVFDDIPEGIIGCKYLSINEAKINLRRRKGGYLTSYNIVEHLAIVGIVPFNKGIAYIFNKELPACCTGDAVEITQNTYESLMNCYVFCSGLISLELLDNLISEYKKRGGIVYDTYHSFEKLELRKARSKRKIIYRNEIVFDSIFKHGFREIGKNKWSDGCVIIQQKQIQRSVLGCHSCNSHCYLQTSLKNKMLIGSVFAKYYAHINQHTEHSFGVVCRTKDDRSYNFAYFEVEDLCKNDARFE